ncbi:MAG: Mu transposase C-terminal domain-containing protein [Sporomusa sp.]
MDAFLAEVALNKPQTLEALNEALALWIQENYHKNVHSALDGLTPEVAFKSDKRALRFADAVELRETFLHSQSRQVDKTGCIHLNGKTYDVGINLIGRKVEVRFDPTWNDKVEICSKVLAPFFATLQVIGEHCGYQRQLPLSLSPAEATESRLLSGLKQNKLKHRSPDTLAIQTTTFVVVTPPGV